MMEHGQSQPEDTNTEYESVPKLPSGEKSRLESALLKREIHDWQAKVDAARLQMHLAPAEVADGLRPHVERLVAEINQASREWRQLSIASDSAQQDLIRGLKLMLRALQRSFERVDWQLERSSNTDPPA